MPSPSKASGDSASLSELSKQMRASSQPPRARASWPAFRRSAGDESRAVGVRVSEYEGSSKVRLEGLLGYDGDGSRPLTSVDRTAACRYFTRPSRPIQRPSWGCSSAGRALQSHCRGQGFDPPQLHDEDATQSLHARESWHGGTAWF